MHPSLPPGPSPARGEVWDADLGIPTGHEQGGPRPCLVVSDDTYNQGPADLVIVVPLTSNQRPIPVHVPVAPPEGGLTRPSKILCDQIRCIARARLRQRRGMVSPVTLQDVEDRLRALLRLP